MPVVDNNILSSLAKAGALDLLPGLFGTVATVPEVMHELRNARLRGFRFVEAIERVGTHGKPTPSRWLGVVTLSEEEHAEKEGLLASGLAPADAECLTVAQHRRVLLLTDDRRLGRTARSRGVRAADLEALLLACARRGLCGSEERMQELLRRVEEQDRYVFSGGFAEAFFDAARGSAVSP